MKETQIKKKLHMKTFLFLLATLTFQTQSNSQKLHAFLFCNTKDPLIGNGAKSNLNHMTAFVKQIATGLGYKLILHTLKDDNFNKQKIADEISKGVKQISKLDVVIAYINTHGYKSVEDPDSFPRLKVGQELVSSFGIHQQLCKVEHRMLLTLIEACSEFAELSPQDSFIVEDSYSDANDKIIEDLSRAKITNYMYQGYLTQSGSYIVSAGQAGSTSYATDEGSFFTTNFIRAFNEAVDTSNDLVDWQGLLTKASYYTYQITQYMRSHPIPIWSFESCERPTKILFSPYKAFSHGYDVTTSATDQLGPNNHKLYKSFFRIDTTDRLDSLTYYLYFDSLKKVVTLRSTDSVTKRYPYHYEIKELDSPQLRGNDFNFLVFSEKEFKFRLKLYYENGGEMDFYSVITYPETKNSWWKDHEIKLVFFISILAVIFGLIKYFLIIKRKNIVK